MMIRKLVFVQDDSSRPQTARTEVPDDEEAGDIPGQVDAEEGDEEEAAEEDQENDGENEDNAEEQEEAGGEDEEAEEDVDMD